MCEQCLAKTMLWKNVLPGWHLVRATQEGSYMQEGDWGLVICNNPSFVFRTRPIKDPFAGMTNEEINNINRDKFSSELSLFESKVNAFAQELFESQDPIYASNNYIRLYEAMKKAGYDMEIHGRAETWLACKIADFLDKNTNPDYRHED